MFLFVQTPPASSPLELLKVYASLRAQGSAWSSGLHLCMEPVNVRDCVVMWAKVRGIKMSPLNGEIEKGISKVTAPSIHVSACVGLCDAQASPVCL